MSVCEPYERDDTCLKECREVLLVLAKLSKSFVSIGGCTKCSSDLFFHPAAESIGHLCIEQSSMASGTTLQRL